MIAQYLGTELSEPIYLYMAGAAVAFNSKHAEGKGEDVHTFIRRMALDCGVVTIGDFFKLCGIHPQSFYTRIGRKKAKVITLPMLEKMGKTFKQIGRYPPVNLVAEFVFHHVDIPADMFEDFGRRIAYHSSYGLGVGDKVSMHNFHEIVQAFYESLEDDEL